MNLIKQLKYDLQNGLWRWQYLLAIPIFLFSCLLCTTECGTYCSLTDYFIFSFWGNLPISNVSINQELHIPTMWLLIINGGLCINLGYMISDLSSTGSQRIIRCRKRGFWFFSKCVWNVTSCFLYFVLALLTVTLFSVLLFGYISFAPSIQLIDRLSEGITYQSSILLEDALLIGIILPLITLITYTILEMALCLFVKPIISFMIGVIIQVVALCYQSPLIIGNGAMVIRNSILVSNGVSSSELLLSMTCTILLSFGIGYHRFSRMDILGAGE